MIRIKNILIYNQNQLLGLIMIPFLNMKKNNFLNFLINKNHQKPQKFIKLIEIS